MPGIVELAEALADSARLAPEEERETYLLYALHYRGAAHFALGDLGEARADFERARQKLRGLLEERLDLSKGPSSFTGLAQVLGGQIMVARLELIALEELWILLTYLAEGTALDDRQLVMIR